MTDASREHLIDYLVDIYSIEQQALAQMRTAPEIAGDGTLSVHFREHLIETERQAERVKDRLDAAGGSPSRVKDAIMRLGGKGFLLFAGAQPDTPGKLAAHAHSYEALELAAYDMLARMARHAGDEETEHMAEAIREEERSMRDRIASDFDEAVEASLRAVGKPASATLDNYLADAHALEAQSVQLLKKSEHIAGDASLSKIYDDHLAESREQSRRIEGRLEALGKSTSVLKDTALRGAALNWGLFFQALSDTPVKLAAFAYAFEHLEIAAYELLRRVASQAGDAETVHLADENLAEERAMADRLFKAFGRAFEVTMAAEPI